MSWSKQKKKEGEVNNVATETIMSQREQRVAEIFGEDYLKSSVNQPPSDLEVNSQSVKATKIESDTQLPVHVAEGLIRQANDPKNQIQIWKNLIQHNSWANEELRKSAKDALEGLIGSLEYRLSKEQIQMQIKQLAHFLVLDFLALNGFKFGEARFSPAYNSRQWKDMYKTLTRLDEKDSHDKWISWNSHQSYTDMTVYSVTNFPYRLSGGVFKAIEVLKKLPQGCIEDIWVADLKQDPILIVQIFGRSYAVHAWDE